jgi:hypothetical protein
MQTPHQYLLLSSPPERKAKFDSYRLQYGSFFAFHGSALVRTPLSSLQTRRRSDCRRFLFHVGKLARHHAQRSAQPQCVFPSCYDTHHRQTMMQASFLSGADDVMW